MLTHRFAGAVRVAPVAALFFGTAWNAYAQTTVSVDAAANRHAISPLVYGTNYGTASTLAALNSPLNRMGGNNTTRYNWKQNADNKANDYFFQSIGDSEATAGARGDSFIRDTRASGVADVQPMLTIPTIGYVAKLGANRNKLASFSISKYGAQQYNDWQWFPDAGNGVRTDSSLITGNDPLDANVVSDTVFQQGWVQHLTATFGLAAKTGLKYYLLDNEPSIWHGTHRDVHPTGATMDEIRDKMVNYATAIKKVDAGALVVGPEEWGWSGYLYSGYDQQWGPNHGWWPLPDRTAHNNWDYLPYLLDQMRQRHTATGQRLLDVFSVHFYPQGGEFSSDVSQAMQLRRNVSTRALWDPNYVDQTWINDKVQLVPRLRGWVDKYYPGTKTAITEYSWGADSHMNGATTQADVLGIFGRENLDMATRWVTPEAGTPTFLAMKLYRNYDDNKSTFGDTSVGCTVPNPDTLAAFAAVRTSDRALTVMVINKNLTSSASVNVNVANFTGQSAAQVWQLAAGTSGAAAAIRRVTDAPVSGSTIALSVPAQSVTLLVVPEAMRGVTPVSIPVTLEGYTGDKTGVPLTVQLRQPGTTRVLQTVSGRLTSGGLLTFSTLVPGTVDVSVKGPTFLRKNTSNVVLSGSSLTLGAVTLLNGDVDGDNKVALPDSTLVRRALGSRSGDANWDARADLNGDGVVNSSDQALVDANYRKNGDL